MSSAVVIFFLSCLAVAAAFVTTLPLKNGGQHWGLIVAGSNGYTNYRHQADACHAYQILLDHGVQPENIVLMMYDDIAYNSENPDKGVLINRPGGENVYKNVRIDYKKEHVTPDVFLAVLQGQKSKVSGKGTGRVIDSGPNDHIFVNFVDHGAPGLVAFPNAELHARTFMNALKSMYAKSRYAQMVIYIEACESGSMFHNLLPDNINIYGTTAANPTEPSYATYYVAHLNTYVGDLYSVKWMENSDVANLKKESLQSQFEVTKRETNMSHVMEYGNLKMAMEPVGDFQGNIPSSRTIYYPHIPLSAVPSRDVELYILQHKMSAAETDDARMALFSQVTKHLQHQADVVIQMKHIVGYALNYDHRLYSLAMSQRSDKINFDCYEPVARYYSANCRRLCKDVTAMKWMFALQNVCNVEGITVDIVFSAMAKVC